MVFNRWRKSTAAYGLSVCMLVLGWGCQESQSGDSDKKETKKRWFHQTPLPLRRPPKAQQLAGHAPLGCLPSLESREVRGLRAGLPHHSHMSLSH